MGTYKRGEKKIKTKKSNQLLHLSVQCLSHSCLPGGGEPSIKHGRVAVSDATSRRGGRAWPPRHRTPVLTKPPFLSTSAVLSTDSGDDSADNLHRAVTLNVRVRRRTHKPLNAHVNVCVHENTRSQGSMRTDVYTQLRHEGVSLSGLPRKQ